jgi:hypothetical protein
LEKSGGEDEEEKQLLHISSSDLNIKRCDGEGLKIKKIGGLLTLLTFRAKH